MRTASYLGFFATVAVAIAVFLLFDSWWLRVIGVVASLAIGWYSLGLYARASTASAARLIRGAGTVEDYDEVGALGGTAAREATRRAADAPDPQRDRIFDDFLVQMGGLEGAQSLVTEHMARHDFDIDAEQASALLDSWRKYGIVRNESLGEYLDNQAGYAGDYPGDVQRWGGERVFAVVDLRRSEYHEGGDVLDDFADRRSAKRYLDDLRERDPKLAARLRIEERWRETDPALDVPPFIFEDGDLESASGSAARHLPGARWFHRDATTTHLVAYDPQNALGTWWSYFKVDEQGALLYAALPATADVQSLFRSVGVSAEWHEVPHGVERTLAATAAWLVSGG
jgi:hypothetical protein